MGHHEMDVGEGRLRESATDRICQARGIWPVGSSALKTGALWLVMLANDFAANRLQIIVLGLQPWVGLTDVAP
jgi:hypothetical protein